MDRDSAALKSGAAATQPRLQKATVSSFGSAAALEKETRLDVVNAGLRPSDAVNVAVRVDGLRPADVNAFGGGGERLRRRT